MQFRVNPLSILIECIHTLSEHTVRKTNNVIGYKTKNIEGKIMVNFACVIGYKIINIEGKINVNYAWWKFWEKHKNTICNNPKCKGNAKKSTEVYVRWTNNITKWSVDRHLGSMKYYLDSNKIE